MVRNNKARIAAWLLVLVLVLVPVTALAQQYLWDAEELLTAGEQGEVSVALETATAQAKLYCGVVTTGSIGGETIESYADKYYHKNGMGLGENKDGTVLFINMGARDVYIYTYGAAIALLDDARIEAALDVVTPQLTNGAYAAAFTAFAAKVQEYAVAGVKADQYSYNVDTGAVEYYSDINSYISWKEFAIALAAAVCTGAVACAIVVGKYKLVFVKDSYPFREKGSLSLRVREDDFLRKSVTQRVIQQSSSGGGSSGGGSRSSTRSSVGGGRHGGGGRKF